LDAVVTQVPEGVIELVDVIGGTTNPEVRIFVNVHFQRLNGAYEDPLADVKLSLIKGVSWIKLF
jgi:hypothetical protein